MEIWLRTNARALLFGMLPPAAMALVGILLITGLGAAPPDWLRGVGVVLVALAVIAIAALAWQIRRPRLAYCSGELLVWLRSGPPLRVPIDVVEAFFLAKVPSLLPGSRHRQSETSALVIRLAQKAPQWHQRDVKLQLGNWCEGYITIRGTWCEPLSVALVNKLNQRLAQVGCSMAAQKTQ